MHDAVARGGGNYHDQHTQGRCPPLCNIALLGRDDIFLVRRHGCAKPKRIAETNIRKGVALCSAIPPRWGEIIYVLCGYAKPTRIAETNIRKGVALCSAIPPRWGEMIFSYAKTRRREANTDSQPRRFHAPGASTLHGMTLAVRFWCRGHTLHGICSG
jgi:NADH:ubiquinone oxidoreductase subunit